MGGWLRNESDWDGVVSKFVVGRKHISISWFVKVETYFCRFVNCGAYKGRIPPNRL